MGSVWKPILSSLGTVVDPVPNLASRSIGAKAVLHVS
jgi:hypothetical protein